MNISLSPELENFVNEKVNSGAYSSPDDLIGDSLHHFQQAIRRCEAKTKTATTETTGDAPLVYARPTTTPDWVLALKPRNPATDGTNGLHRVIGKWPGDETEEELLALERQIDDEDAGRI